MPGRRPPQRGEKGKQAERLRKAGRFKEAEHACREALVADPQDAVAANVLGQVLIQRADWEGLHQEMERRVAQSFQGVEALWEKSNVTLLFGDLPQGWAEYEARWLIPGLIGPERQFVEPRWDGESFAGKTLLLHWEQGQGDTLMFLRYAPMAKARGGQVLVAVQPSVAGVTATCQGVDGVIPHGAPLPPFDLQLPMMSLPAVFKTTLDSIPAEIPYLDVPDSVPNQAALAQALGTGTAATRVGLVWAGSRTNTYDAERSISAEDLKPLADIPGVTWYSLQPGLTGQAPFPGIVALGPHLSSFSDTAYALSALDLVITVDTAVAHLAGALGIPTLLLVACLPDWRWLMGREDSPWYPSLRIYRQPVHGDWRTVIQQVLADLTAES